MNKDDIVKELSLDFNKTLKQTRLFVDTILEEIILVLEEEEPYSQIGFGTFHSEFKEERLSYNPAIKKKMRLPIKQKLTFKPSIKLKEEING